MNHTLFLKAAPFFQFSLGAAKLCYGLSLGTCLGTANIISIIILRHFFYLGYYIYPTPGPLSSPAPYYMALSPQLIQFSNLNDYSSKNITSITFNGRFNKSKQGFRGSLNKSK